MTVDLHAAPFALDDEGRTWVEQTLESLTLEQRVGQVMCTYLRSTDVPEWTAWLDERGIEPGGMMMMMRPRDDARRDSQQLHSWSKVPLLMAANLESGGVNFLTDTEAFANPMQLAATGDAASATLLATHCARIGNDLGINWAFAPVVDIVVNPANPITNTRAFGSDSQVVADFSVEFIRELESRGIATSAKHFPGDGVDDRDQHLTITNNDLAADDWWQTYGMVYRRAIEAGTRTVMIGHIRQPSLSRSHNPDLRNDELLPATLAPELLQGVLRGELGFNGLIVSDNTAMTGFSAAATRAEGLIGSILAGVDMILGNLDVAEDYSIILEAARSGRIPPERLDDAVRRVLAVKASIGLHRSTDRSDRELSNEAEEHSWRDDIARRSVTLVKDTQDLLPLSVTRHRRVLVYVIGDEATYYDPTPPLAPRFVEGLRVRGMDVTVRSVPGSGTTPLEAEHLHERFDLCLYFSALRFVGNTNYLRLTWSPWQGWDSPRHVASLPTAFVSIADPFQLQDVPMIRTAINGYTPTSSVVDAVLATLFGEQPARGKSPVDPFVGHWDAAL